MMISFKDNPIVMSIFDPTGKPISISQGISSPHVVVLDGPLWNVSGTYTIIINLASGKASASFEFDSGTKK